MRGLTKRKPNFSPLMDPLILETSLLKRGGGFQEKYKTFFDQMEKINWFQIIWHWVVPIGVLLFIAFQLRKKYDQKNDLAIEYASFQTLPVDDDF